ncbi:hypothetical protein FB451DRAFT_1408702 [Mycena latifolia]|nr:hypothetical protein FB451DRAFT_1408702 [Mycena latifolia]
MVPQFTPAQEAMAETFREIAAAELAWREANPDLPNPDNQNTSPDASPLLDEGVRGVTRQHTDDGDFPSQIMDNPLAPYTLEEGREIKRHKHLSPQSDADLDFFLKTSNPGRHMFQIAVFAVQCRDTLQIIKSDQDKKYKLTDTLTKTCQEYAHVAMLSPKAKSYRNVKSSPTVTSTIVNAMRMLGISDMPPSKEVGRCEVLNKIVGKALTDKRYHIKVEIFLSIANDAVKINIAQLARNCIGTSPAKATAGMYQRLAFIRKVAVDYKKKGGSVTGKPTDDSKDDFWPTVDAALFVMSTFSATERQMTFDSTYRKDLEINGPVDNTIPITPAKDLDAWVVTVNMAMEK